MADRLDCSTHEHRIKTLEGDVDKLAMRVDGHHEHIIGAKALVKVGLVLVPIVTAILVALLNHFGR